MKPFILVRFALSVAVLVLARSALASEEHIVPWHSVTVVAQAGEPQGDVRVTIDTQQVADFDVKIKTLKIVSRGKKLVVPKEAIATIKNPALDTLRISHEAGYDKHPWLYVSIAVGAPQRGMPRVYLAFQNGKFVKRFTATRQKDGGRTFTDEWKP
jgi:hypothetical protein